MPSRAAASTASRTPETVSWSVSANSSTPARAAAATTSPGGSAPSDAVECPWRSKRVLTVRRSDQRARLQELQHAVDEHVRRLGPHHELRRVRRLVRVVDARHALDLAAPRLRVEPLRVALLAQLERRVDEDLDERQPRALVDLARESAVRPVRTDERNQHDGPGVRE